MRRKAADGADGEGFPAKENGCSLRRAGRIRFSSPLIGRFRLRRNLPISMFGRLRRPLICVPPVELAEPVA